MIIFPVYQLKQWHEVYVNIFQHEINKFQGGTKVTTQQPLMTVSPLPHLLDDVCDRYLCSPKIHLLKPNSVVVFGDSIIEW